MNRPSAEHNPDLRNKLASMKILIVEDDAYSKEYLLALLGQMVKKAFHARNGAEAVELFLDHPEIGLIFMDIKMPVMDGFTATRKIRELDRDVVIIAQTAYAMPSDRVEAIQAGCNDHIAKPIESNILFTLMERHLLV
ncbi:MAG: response regulator [Bacteroidales bacterium]